MGKINMTIPDELENRFRDKAYKVKGKKKGFLQDAIVEAFEDWVKKK